MGDVSLVLAQVPEHERVLVDRVASSRWQVSAASLLIVVPFLTYAVQLIGTGLQYVSSLVTGLVFGGGAGLLFAFLYRRRVLRQMSDAQGRTLTRLDVQAVASCTFAGVVAPGDLVMAQEVWCRRTPGVKGAVVSAVVWTCAVLVVQVAGLFAGFPPAVTACASMVGVVGVAWMVTLTYRFAQGSAKVNAVFNTPDTDQ